MKSMVKSENGQVMVIVVVVLTVLLGFTALTVDGGTGYVAKSKLQNAVDAAALAGAQQLPDNTAQAIADAQEYAQKNGIDLVKDNVTFSIENDDHSIKVAVQRTLPTYFARVFGKNSTIVSADATGTAGYAASVPWIVPFVIPQPLEFNYDEVYVMRIYGGGPYPSNGFKYVKQGWSWVEQTIKPYSYPDDYKKDPRFKDYPLTGATNVYTTKAKVQLKKEPTNNNTTPGNISPSQEIPKNAVVTYNYYKNVGYRNTQTWFNVTYGSRTGWAKKEEFSINLGPGNIYPYQFDYMNVFIKKESGFSQYINWLENGYHDKFSVGEKMYYYAKSSGGKESWDAFENRVTRDKNTDYTKAKVGDGRVILIPIVDKLLPRNTPENTPMTVRGFVAFFIQAVHKNEYGTTAWFEGRFLENVKIENADFTFDPDANYGIQVVKLTE